MAFDDRHHTEMVDFFNVLNLHIAEEYIELRLDGPQTHTAPFTDCFRVQLSHVPLCMKHGRIPRLN